MKRSLRHAGLTLQDGPTCLNSPCPFCAQSHTIATHTQTSRSLYVNKTTGFFICSCTDRRQGQWGSLERCLKGRAVSARKETGAASGGSTTPKRERDKEIVSPPPPTANPFTARWTELQADSTALGDLMLQELDDLFCRFNLPVFPEAGRVLREVRVGPQGLLFPLKDLAGEVCGVRILSPPSHEKQDHKLNEDSGNAEEEQVEGSGGLLQLCGGTVAGSTAKGATLVPTAGDAVALASIKAPGLVLCPARGLSSLPQETLPQLEELPRLLLWPGTEHAHHTHHLARKLQDTRCYLVRSPEADCGALELVRGGAGGDAKALLGAARPLWHRAITTFSTLREDVLSDLHNIDKVEGVKWRRFPALTRLLRGHRRGELTVLTGPTGCGKTTFCSEYSLDLAMQGVSTLWGSFEVRNSRLARTMLQQLAGLPLEQHLQLFTQFADQFEKLPIFFLTFHGQQSIKDVMEAVEHASYVHDIAHVVVDNVQFLLGVSADTMAKNDRFWRQDALIAAFRTFATRRNCHVTLVMHPRKERDMDELSTSSIFGSAKASQEADNVLIIQDKRLTAVRGKKYLQVAKNRYSGDLGIVPLEFDKAGLSYAHKKKEPAPKQKDALPSVS